MAELLAPTSTRKMESTAPRCRQHHSEATRRWLSCWSSRAPTSTRKVEALPAASFGGYEVVELLVKQGADVNAQGGMYSAEVFGLQKKSFKLKEEVVRVEGRSHSS